ncbi:uncharacterized protein LOC128736295 [Sabethes cyaneus]|uniref:uncharacterized protein LOC128736295 n=1 Tax=Sabethes cyaneus TaxID=53552 RepID=UPI00237E3F91|nr:uncharacterized protein LOC128736295 [Sabethes cyaneus]
MKKVRSIAVIIQRVLITLLVFWSAMKVIHHTSIVPTEKAILDSCDRPCNRADWPRICRYKLVVEKRTVFKSSVDHKSIISDAEPAGAVDAGQFAGGRTGADDYYLVNGKHTGPTLSVCENDFIVIDVENRVPGQSISIHWTGQTQRHTPFMDGVPMVTQCPIASYTTFQYKFQADRAGTHLYHGFSSEERKMGLVGGLLVHTVHEQRKHPLTKNIRGDKIWIISEGSGSLLINGKSRLLQPVLAGGVKYRFRVAYIAPVDETRCERWLEIQDHHLTVVAIDGNLIEPLVVQRMALSDGDRVDFILQTATSAKDYQIRLFAGSEDGKNGTCFQRRKNILSNRFKLRMIANGGEGPLSQEVASNGLYPNQQQQQHPLGFNVGRSICEETPFSIGSQQQQQPQYRQLYEQQVCLLGARASNDDDTAGKDKFPPLLRTVDRQIKLILSKQKIEREIFGEHFHDISYSVNGFSFIFPTVLMLSNIRDGELVPHLCGNSSRINSANGHSQQVPSKCHWPTTLDKSCECVHVETIETGHRVELVLINEDPDSDHSYHLHGYRFYLLAATRCSDKGCLNQLEAVHRNFDRPIQRDTIKIEKRSLAVLRFVAANAGLWMLRDLGAWSGWSRGLDVLLSVTDTPPQQTGIDFPPGFPTCRNFIGPKYFLI